MRKKILLSVILLFVSISTMAVGQDIGYMNTSEVLSNLPKTQEIQQTLNQLIQQKQGELEEKSTTFQNALADYQENKDNMSSAEATKKEKKLQQLRQELNEFNESIKQEIQERRNKLLRPVLEAIDKAISSVAEAKGLDLVINKTTNSGADVIFYASDTQENITEEVLQKAQTIIE